MFLSCLSANVRYHTGSSETTASSGSCKRKARGWTGSDSKTGTAWRTRVIFQTNCQTSYAAGRFAQLKEGGYDLWVYHHNDGVQNPRPQHLAWNGLALPPDHSFWQTHYPPNGWGCQCYVTGAYSKSDVKRQDGNPAKTLPSNWQHTNPKTGEPVGIDKGWGYAPGASVAHTITALATKLLNYPASLGADFWAQAVPKGAQQRHQQAWADYLAQTSTPEGLRTAPNQFIVGGIAPSTLNALQESHPELIPRSAEIAVRKADIAHFARDSKQNKLTAEAIKNLPSHLRQAAAVLLDTTQKTPALLYVIQQSPQQKLIVKLDYTLKNDQVVNVLRSGRMLDEKGVQSMKGLVEGGIYQLLEGKL